MNWTTLNTKIFTTNNGALTFDVFSSDQVVPAGSVFFLEVDFTATSETGKTKRARGYGYIVESTGEDNIVLDEDELTTALYVDTKLTFTYAGGIFTLIATQQALEGVTQWTVDVRYCTMIAPAP